MFVVAKGTAHAKFNTNRKRLTVTEARSSQQRTRVDATDGARNARGAPEPQRALDEERRLYGFIAVQVVFARRPQVIRKLYVAEARIPQLQPLLKWCVANRVGYRVVDEADLRKLAASAHHEGVVADVLRESPQSDRKSTRLNSSH